ncbi:unnamed protein product [Adineta ricciae]|uniref:Uncharacterized protein n=1 Tax=Adineta ricciae TaxID=249248 RepID=A0A815S3K0_ADIRI|nr:unnamed protein product [Adineta ricciae]CAF1486615.1 unnamed protein product [Adineta ricciae]
MNTSDRFIITHSINFCSCYSPQNLLNQYTNVTPIAISHPFARYVLYNPYDNTLIVLGDNLIGQYYVSNLTRFRTLSVTITPLAAVVDSNSIYVAFGDNMSVSKYDMKLTFNRSVSIPTTSSSSFCYGLALWKNGLFVTDDQKNLIWFIDSTTMNISLYLKLTNYSIEPFSIVVYNNVLYISQLSSAVIYVYDLVSKSMRSLTFPNSTALYRLGMDPYCNRIWFGTQSTTFSSVPVIDLASHEPAVYYARGALTTGPTYKIEFDSNYAMYTVAVHGNYFYKYPMSAIFCDKN